MSYWIELHCDVLADGTPDGMQACQTNHGDSPGVMVEKVSDIPGAVLALRQGALKHGWIALNKVKFACPYCKGVN